MPARGRKCGICHYDEGYGVDQTVYAIVNVASGLGIYRCSSCLNLPPRVGEAKKLLF